MFAIIVKKSNNLAKISRNSDIIADKKQNIKEFLYYINKINT